MKRLGNNNGEILTISLIFIGLIMIIFVFSMAIFMSHVNTILYNLKLDMYSLNRSAIIAVNKYKTSVDDFSYDIQTYKSEFIKGLKENYELDKELENEEKLITKVEVIEYTIYEENQKDSYTKNRTDSRVLHTVLKVRIRPIILRDLLESIFVFTIHEDVTLNSMKVD